MDRSTLMASALAALLAVSYLGTAQADKKGGYVETDLAIGGPHVTTTTPQTLTDANGIVHTAKCNDPNPVTVIVSIQTS